MGQSNSQYRRPEACARPPMAGHSFSPQFAFAHAFASLAPNEWAGEAALSRGDGMAEMGEDWRAGSGLDRELADGRVPTGSAELLFLAFASLRRWDGNRRGQRGHISRRQRDKHGWIKGIVWCLWPTELALARLPAPRAIGENCGPPLTAINDGNGIVKEFLYWQTNE